jgi:hypothetical protein
MEQSVFETVYPTLSSAITALEGNGVLASDVWLFSCTVRCMLEENEVPCEKLKTYLGWKQPALGFWNNIGFLDHLQVIFEATSKLPDILCKISKVQIDYGELVSYRLLVRRRVRATRKNHLQSFGRITQINFRSCSDLF